MRVKLIMNSCSFNVNEAKRTVTAVVKTMSEVGFYDQENITIGIARCDERDTFDVEIGKRIAKARAEREAYIQHRNIIIRHIKKCSNTLRVLEDSLERTKRNIEHQGDYINSIKQ